MLYVFVPSVLYTVLRCFLCSSAPRLWLNDLKSAAASVAFVTMADAHLSQQQLLEIGKNRLAAYRAAKQQQQQQQQQDAHPNGDGSHQTDANGNGTDHLSTQQQQQQQHQQQGQTQALDLGQLQQQYTTHYQQYGSDPRYAEYFRDLYARILTLQEQQQQKQQQQTQTTQQTQQPEAEPISQPAVMATTNSQQAEAASATAAAPAAFDFNLSPTLQSYSPEQRNAFLSFAAYYNDPNYAGYYQQLREKPEYQSYFQIMDIVQQEVAYYGAQQQQQQQQQPEQAQTQGLAATETSSVAASVPAESRTQEAASASQSAEAQRQLVDPSQLQQPVDEPSSEQRAAEEEPSFPAGSTTAIPTEQPLATAEAAAVPARVESVAHLPAPIEPSDRVSPAPELPSTTTVDAEELQPSPAMSDQSEPVLMEHTQEEQQSERQLQTEPERAAERAQSSHSPFAEKPRDLVDEPTAVAAPSMPESQAADEEEEDEGPPPLEPIPPEAPQEYSSERLLQYQQQQQLQAEEAYRQQQEQAYRQQQEEAYWQQQQQQQQQQQPYRQEQQQAEAQHQQEQQRQQLQQQQLQHALLEQSQQPPAVPAFLSESAPTEPPPSSSVSSSLLSESIVPAADPRAAALAELESLRAALAAKDAEISRLSTRVNPLHSALMSAETENVSLSDMDAGELLRERMQVQNMSNTITSLSREVDSLRAENDKLYAQQNILRHDVGERNARVEQLHQDNVALLLEIETMEKELKEIETLRAAVAARPQPPSLTSPGSTSAGQISCDHGSIFSELHDVHSQIAHLWGRNIRATHDLEELAEEVTLAIEAAARMEPQLLLQGESNNTSFQTPADKRSPVPSGLITSFTPDVSGSTYQHAEQEASRPRSNSDPNAQQLLPAPTTGSEPLTPQKAPAEQRLVPSANSSSILSSLLAQASNIHSLLRSKGGIESQLHTLLARASELCDPINTLLSSESPAAAGVSKALKGLPKKPPGVVVAKSVAVPDERVVAQISELRSALSAQMERSNLLIRDKILLAKRIEDAVEERDIIVGNLREQIEQINREKEEWNREQQRLKKLLEEHKIDEDLPPPLEAMPTSADEQQQPQLAGVPPSPQQRHRYDRALSPDGAIAAAPSGAPQDLRELNSFYVDARRPSAAPVEGEKSQRRPSRPPHQPDQRSFSDGELLQSQQQQTRGLFSTLLSFFFARFSQRGYEEALREAQRRRRQEEEEEQARALEEGDTVVL
jgi:hypothetical protein